MGKVSFGNRPPGWYLPGDSPDDPNYKAWLDLTNPFGKYLREKKAADPDGFVEWVRDHYDRARQEANDDRPWLGIPGTPYLFF